MVHGSALGHVLLPLQTWTALAQPECTMRVVALHTAILYCAPLPTLRVLPEPQWEPGLERRRLQSAMAVARAAGAEAEGCGVLPPRTSLQ